MAADLCTAAQTALSASGVPSEAADMEMRIASQLAALEHTGFGQWNPFSNHLLSGIAH